MKEGEDMGIKEVFLNPTVKQVAFDIRFPNLFYLESKIGDFQVQIMEEFPESALLFRRQIVFADMGPAVKIEEVEEKVDKEWATKVWNFKSPRNFELDVSTSTLVISSLHHKTYNLGVGDKFRDIIRFVVDKFLEVTSIPTINRIGLRYIDECPIPSKDNKTFRAYYNSVFPVDRFNMTDANEMNFKTMVKRGDYFLRYIESLQKVKDDYKLILDLDGFATSINAKDYLAVTDKLHEIISDEYESAIKEPVKEYMRKPKEG
jgi:uncharacterized protein (TIGR04255 family)